MKFDPKIHHRRSIRLKGYDYSQAGAYFVTMVAWQRECLFGDVVDGEMRLNCFGKIVENAWFDLPNHYGHVELGAFCIMPNHVHGIVVLIDDGRGGSSAPDNVNLPDGILAGKPSLPDKETRPYGKPEKHHPLSEIIRAFKSFSAKRINVLRKTPGIPVWQRNYYERIIRNEREMDAIWRYIEANPANWGKDGDNPAKLLGNMPNP